MNFFICLSAANAYVLARIPWKLLLRLRFEIYAQRQNTIVQHNVRFSEVVDQKMNKSQPYSDTKTGRERVSNRTKMRKTKILLFLISPL
jgi:hypothetical protein